MTRIFSLLLVVSLLLNLNGCAAISASVVANMAAAGAVGGVAANHARQQGQYAPYPPALAQSNIEELDLSSIGVAEGEAKIVYACIDDLNRRRAQYGGPKIVVTKPPTPLENYGDPLGAYRPDRLAKGTIDAFKSFARLGSSNRGSQETFSRVFDCALRRTQHLTGGL